jgi:hypothetical protein
MMDPQDLTNPNGMVAVVAGPPAGPAGSSAAVSSEPLPYVPLPLGLEIPDGAQGEMIWYAPALRASLHTRISSLLEELQGMATQYPTEVWKIRFDYETRARAAALELEQIEQASIRQYHQRLPEVAQRVQELETEIARVREMDVKAQQRLSEEEEAFAQAMAAAGLPWEVKEKVTALAVEEALHHAVPTVEMLAGEHGIEPPPSRPQPSLLNQIRDFLFAIGAPAVFGFLVALCLSTVTGLVSISDLQRSDRIGLLAMIWILGTILVLVLGEAVVHAAKALARQLESGRFDQAGNPVVPRMRGKWVAFAILFLIAMVAAAELTIEAIGLHEMYMMRRVEQARFTTGQMLAPMNEELPLSVFFLMGMVITGVYLVYKFPSAWNESENRLRRAWLEWMQEDYLNRRRENENVQEAFRQAERVAQAAARKAEIGERLALLEQRRVAAAAVQLDPDTLARLKYTFAAAVGEAQRLHDAIEQLMNKIREAEGASRPTQSHV